MSDAPEMVERIARVLCRASHIPEGCGWSADEIEDFVGEHWPIYIPDARTVIAAMREPTLAMLKAGFAKCSTATEESSRGLIGPWHGMIDGALEERSETSTREE